MYNLAKRTFCLFKFKYFLLLFFKYSTFFLFFLFFILSCVLLLLIMRKFLFLTSLRIRVIHTFYFSIFFLHSLYCFFLFLSLPAVQPWMSSSRTNSNSTKGEDEETPTEFEFLTIRPIISRCYLFQIKRTISTHPAATFHFLSHLVSDKLFHLIIETYLSSPSFSLSRTQLLLISFFHPSLFSMLDESLSNRWNILSYLSIHSYELIATNRVGKSSIQENISLYQYNSSISFIPFYPPSLLSSSLPRNFHKFCYKGVNETTFRG